MPLIDVYPTLNQVRNASHYELGNWSRHLRIANDKNELAVIDLIRKRFLDMGGMTDKLSSEIGWE